jgi:hypothetical protein
MGSAIGGLGSVASTIGGGIAGGPVGAALGNIVGGGALSGLLFGNSNDPRSLVNSVDPNIESIYKQQLKQANDFNSNINNFEKDQINASTDASRLKTQQQQKESTANSNARGMLYGAYDQNKSNGIAASNESDLNKRIGDINYGAQATGQDLTKQAAQSGLVLQGFNQDYNNALYNTALSQQQNKSNSANGLIGGVSKLAGLA